jgi:hypothetical protein
MAEVQTGATGAKRTRWKDHNPSAALARLMESFPTAGEGELVDRLMRQGEENEHLNRAIYEYFVRNTVRAIEDNKKAVSRPRPRPSPAATRDVEEAIHDRLAEVAEELFALSMPNGKDLGDCTGKDLDLMGKATERLRKFVPANKTVREALDKRHLSVEQIEALRASFKPKK